MSDTTPNPALRLIPMENRLLEGTFGDIIVQGSTWLSQEQRQPRPTLLHITDGLPEGAVGLDLLLVDLVIEPGPESAHERTALGLVMPEAFLR